MVERHPNVLIVEDDHAGRVSGAPAHTLTAPSRTRWAVIRSVAKDLHPDLRLALMAGDETTIARVEGRQALGPRWVSHITQGLVAELLRDSAAANLVATAATVYAQRREALLTALADEGIPAHGRSGLNVWVPVREKAPVVRALLDAGWLVLAGERCRIQTPPGVRITVAAVTRQDEAREIARVIATVERAGHPRRVY